ncbi:MAG: alpha,alpha-trehalose-phosphate synthase (UDP-forming) [Thermoanaerobaculia bacterium]
MRLRLFNALPLLDERAPGCAMLAIILTLLLAAVFAGDRKLQSWHARDLTRRAALVAASLESEIEDGDTAAVQSRINRLTMDERLYGVVVCYPGGARLANRSLGSSLLCNSNVALAATREDGTSILAQTPAGDMQVSFFRGPNRTRIYVAHDRAFIWSRRYWLIRMLLAGGLTAMLGIWATLWITGRMTRDRTRLGMRNLFSSILRGDRPASDLPPEWSPLVDELNARVASLRAERRANEEQESGPQRLRRLVGERMPSTNLVLLANREPYIHTRDRSGIRIDRPASGLVTGVEPLLKACGGVWVAHGSGSGDRESSDAKGRLAVPPESPEYVLRRIWLTRREEEGYYYGFANEGLWPLCHIAHARPTFRSDDWEQYCGVNRRFAAAAAEEAGQRGLVLVQDYHFALVPSELRKLAPDLAVSLFWHIPWPNHEVVGICPWKRELLEGMLGADVVGFHTRYHCLNFLETAQRYLECRVDLESMSIEYQGRKTRVRPYPISVEWPYPAATAAEGSALRQSLGIGDDVHVAVGVDRTDYTKGLPERVAAIEAMLTEHPEIAGKFVYVQLAAPSRTHIKRYRDLVSEIEDEVTRVNRRFARDGWQPIQLEMVAKSPQDVRRYYAMGDIALVTPLHDGMNLVAKEYVASCDDDHGVLILSAFAGASKELEGALIVNPYDITDMSRALWRAITMSEQEQAARLRAMRAAIEKNTIYDWAASLLTDLADIWDRRHATPYETIDT